LAVRCASASRRSTRSCSSCESKFRLLPARELALQPQQPVAQHVGLLDLLREHLELPLHHARNGGFRACQERSDLGQRHPEAPQRLDLVQPGDVGLVVEPIAAVGAGRRREQADGVVVVQHADAQSATLGKIANFQQHGMLRSSGLWAG
jgi:hypothetical protein